MSQSHALMGISSDSGSSEGTNAKFIITGGTLNSAYGPGIYAPQVNGETIISGGTITGGRTGIEIRAGSLTITGGTITGNMEEYDYTDNRNGLTTKGAAVSVCQHTTKQPITVNISGGTFDAKVPFSEVNALENPQEDVAKINYDISGGVFHSSSTETVQIGNYVNGPFIYGGKYTHYVTDYVKEGYGEKIENDPIRPEPNMKAVYKWREVSWRPEGENGTINVERHKTTFDDGTTITTEPDGQEPIVDPEDPTILKLRVLYNDRVYIYPSPNDGYEVSNVSALDENGNVISVDGDMYLSPDANSVVTVDFTKEENGNTDPNYSDPDDNGSDSIYDDTEDGNGSGENSSGNSSGNPSTGDCISDLFELLLAASLVVILVI